MHSLYTSILHARTRVCFLAVCVPLILPPSQVVTAAREGEGPSGLWQAVLVNNMTPPPQSPNARGGWTAFGSH